MYIPIETGKSILLTKAGWIDKKFKLATNDLNTNIVLNAILLNPKRKNIFTPNNSVDLIFFFRYGYFAIKF